MLRFREFLWDIRFAWLAGILAFFLSWAPAFFEYSAKINGANLRIYLVRVLDHGAGHTEFKRSVRTLLEGSAPLEERLSALRHYMRREFQDFRESFQNLDGTTLSALIARQNDGTTLSAVIARQNVDELIRAEMVRRDAVRFDWFYGAWYALLAWKIVGVASLLFFWWRESYIMSYFPYRSWWFWVYGAAAWPWSLGVAFVLSWFFMWRGICRIIAWRRGRKAPITYEKLLDSVRSRLPESRAVFEELFPPIYRGLQEKVLQERADLLRKELEVWGSVFAEKERLYRKVCAELELVPSSGEPLDAASFAARKEEWDKELDKILAIPLVKAVRVGLITDIIDKNDLRFGKGKCLEVFTSVIPTILGNLGPLRIIIDLESSKPYYGVLKGHESTTQGGVGWNMFSGTFCFGDNHSTIDQLIYERKLSNAVGLMVAQFQSGALELI